MANGFQNHGGRFRTERKLPVTGPDPWRQLAGGAWTHWDLWLSVVCVADHDGDWESLGTAIERGHLPGSSDAEGLRSHVDDLIARLVAAGLDARQLVGDFLDKPALRQKARSKVIRQGLMMRDLTDPMVNTPRRRLRERALRGGWHGFPISPETTYERFIEIVDERPHYGERAAMALARRLEAALVRGGHRELPAEQLARYRAFLSAGYEAHQRANDSCGDMGRVLKDAWRAYAGLPWRASGIEPSRYYQDLCEMLVWDDFSSLFEIEEVPFGSVATTETEEVDVILRGLWSELAGARLRFHSDRALQARAWLRMGARDFDGFAEVAGNLGSEYWIPIDRMARKAVEDGRPDVAKAVFDAADRPGPHRDHLRRRRLELLGPPATGRPKLPLVT
jgi:hypothetical protein